MSHSTKHFHIIELNRTMNRVILNGETVSKRVDEVLDTLGGTVVSVTPITSSTSSSVYWTVETTETLE